MYYISTATFYDFYLFFKTLDTGARTLFMEGAL